ncbi:MAG: hypothetical protein ACPGGM_01565 [Porticoccaceae bacterium]
MRTTPAFGEPQDGSSFSGSNCPRILYMSHLALGDYIYQGPFLRALTESNPNIRLDIWIDDCRKKRKLGMLGGVALSSNGCLANLI